MFVAMGGVFLAACALPRYVATRSDDVLLASARRAAARHAATRRAGAARRRCLRSSHFAATGPNSRRVGSSRGCGFSVRRRSPSLLLVRRVHGSAPPGFLSARHCKRGGLATTGLQSGAPPGRPATRLLRGGHARLALRVPHLLARLRRRPFARASTRAVSSARAARRRRRWWRRWQWRQRDSGIFRSSCAAQRRQRRGYAPPRPAAALR